MKIDERRILNLCISLALFAMIVAPSYGQRYAYRGHHWNKTEFNSANPIVDYPVCNEHMDYGYSGGEVELFANVTLAFPEYYISWHEGQMETDPGKNDVVKWIVTYGGPKGQNLYGLKIAREVLVGKPPGPIANDPRILFESDIAAIRKVLTDAKNAGILVRDDYKLIQMVEKPNEFAHSTQAQELIKMMDGVCYESHHFGLHWPLSTGRSKPSDVAEGAQWVLSNTNIYGQQLDYVFYYGPYKGYDCSDVNAGDEDPFRLWMEEYWAAGLPKKHPGLIYDFNAFPHHCGSSRPVLPESNPYSTMGCIKWLIEQVENAGDIKSGK